MVLRSERKKTGEGPLESLRMAHGEDGCFLVGGDEVMGL